MDERDWPGAEGSVGAELLQRIANQGAPSSHLRRLHRLRELAQGPYGMQALVLVGSYAAGRGNRLSDLDLIAWASPGAASTLMAQARHILTAAEPVLDRFDGQHGEHGRFSKWVYLDFSSVELHVFELGGPLLLKRPYLVVWDPQQLARTLEIAGPPVRHEDFQAYEYGDEGLVWELVDCIKWLKRGETRLAKDYLLKLSAALRASGHRHPG
jgi:predicted nucleotidyltransferase